TGQNGFRLSLLGFEPEFDHESLVSDARGRRVFLANPEQSLILLKATARLPHGGGKVMEEAAEDYKILSQWINEGARGPQPDDPTIAGIELEQREKTLKFHDRLVLKAIARFSDGSSRDVTRQAVYQSNEPGIALVDSQGVISVQNQPGLVAVMVRFGEKMATFRGVVPFEQEWEKRDAVERTLNDLSKQKGQSVADGHLFNQWRKLGLVPSAKADDLTFLRRAMLDICGTLPTEKEMADFTNDSDVLKRQKLVDELLERPEYASYFALKWADILQNRGAGYSTSRQRAGTTLFSGWIRDSIAANKPYHQFVSEIITASGSQSENPPAIWYRTVRKSPEYVESVAQAFLGVRIQCAQCHHHPTERWSQDDYYGLAAVFARVGRKGGFADAEVPTDEVIYLAPKGSVVHPRTGAEMRPRPLGEKEFQMGPLDDPRKSLARWMTSPENPFFARTVVNRLWAHFMGRGIVHPLDDARSTNPPSNPELLNALAADFVSHGYDIKHLIRQITGSYAYQITSVSEPGNKGDMQSFSRFYSRRIPAEPLLDAISQVLGVATDFPGMPPGTRAIELPDENVAAPFLDIFGRPARLTACECERVDAPALHQALELVNSAEIQRKLSAPASFPAVLATSGKNADEIVHLAFVRILSRPPRPEEKRASVGFLERQTNRPEAIQSLVWSLLATNEFLFNH
ncbi:MAG: DUF1549 and DUF1553 domain-containing protein, partial [bacterium]